MIARILWSFVLVATCYVLAVFFMPDKADELGDVFGIKEFNVILREAKSGWAQDIKLNLESGSGGIMWNFQEKVDSARSTAEEAKRLIDLKKNQAEALIDSSNAVIDNAKKAQSDFNALTSLSGSSGSGGVSGSWKTLTGATASGSVRTRTR